MLENVMNPGELYALFTSVFFFFFNSYVYILLRIIFDWWKKVCWWIFFFFFTKLFLSKQCSKCLKAWLKLSSLSCSLCFACLFQRILVKIQNFLWINKLWTFTQNDCPVCFNVVLFYILCLSLLQCMFFISPIPLFSLCQMWCCSWHYSSFKS